MNRIHIICGERNTGKTSICQKLAEIFKKSGNSVKGIISPGVYKYNKKVAIDAVDIATGKVIKLADYIPGWDPKKPISEWKVNKDAILWGNSVLKNSIPCDVLIIDEIGYLEFEKKDGWLEAFIVLETNQYKVSFIVVRNSLVKEALLRWPEAKIMRVKDYLKNKSIVNELVHQFVNNEKR